MIQQISVSKTNILEALKQGATVVTGSKRLAATLQQDYAQSMLERGQQVWETPDIVPWPIWLQSSWEAASLSGAFSEKYLPLSPAQETCIWEQVVTECSTEHPFLQIPATARRAQQAWQLMQAWHLPLNEEAFSYNSDSCAFYQWAKRFEKRCQVQDWLPADHVIGQLKTAAEAGLLSLPQELVLLGFEELTPQQDSFLDALLASGCQVHWQYIAAKNASITRIECKDIADEITSMARWVKQQISENSDAQIAVVVPDLAFSRTAIMKALDEVLFPQVLLPGNQYLRRPYNVSLGLALNQYPIIQIALILLGFYKRLIDVEDVSQILLSPFMAGWAEEASPRALLELQLRKIGEPKVSLKTLRYYAAQNDRSYSCPILAALITDWIEATTHFSRQHSATQWAESFSRALKAIGWSAGRSLSSEEFQTVEAWRGVVHYFSTLEAVSTRYTASAALSLLKRLTLEQTFQPQGHVTSVQVLGVFEATGLQFDHLWVMGMHDEVWPAAANSNPFIPLPMQRDAGLPHCNEARELRMCQWVSARLFFSADEIRVSYPLKDQDKILRPSALIMSMDEITVEAIPSWREPLWKEQVRLSQHLEPIEDDTAPALTESMAQGGSSVFKHQAACPFRAFAEHRLGAKPRSKTALGLNAMVRGILTHTMLEKLWCELRSKQKLMQLENTALESLLRDKSNEVVNALAPRYPVTLTRRMKKMEVERLTQQCQQWLAVEKQRKDFKVVATEAQYTVALGGLQVNLKIDRIDELVDGRQIVIDYKTGKVSPAEWFGDRPSDPQLPLYSVALCENSLPLAGISFAQIRPHAMQFNGVLAEAELLPEVKAYTALKSIDKEASWDSVLAQWRQTLEHLAVSFRQGHATVDPKKYPATCEYCHLHALCRIHTLREEASKNTDEVSV